MLAGRGWESSRYTTTSYIAVLLTALLFGGASMLKRWRKDRDAAIGFGLVIGCAMGITAYVLAAFAQAASQT